MTERNRVTPFGAIEALEGRGRLTGNRGNLHDHGGAIVRPYKSRAWISCLTAFKERHSPLRPPGRFTWLFFLDEATALAAGHRPCGECRRRDLLRFQSAWPHAERSAPAIDARLHEERVNGRGRASTKRTYEADPHSLPDGAFVALDGAAWLVHGGGLRRWSMAGYGEARALPARSDTVAVLTPPSMVASLANGYDPGL